jgi:hypothetical protein
LSWLAREQHNRPNSRLQYRTRSGAIFGAVSGDPHAARLARGLPLGRDDPPRLAQVALERVIRDLIEQDADPPAGADIPRLKIDVGRFFDHHRLQPSATGTQSDGRPSSRWCSENIAKQLLPGSTKKQGAPCDIFSNALGSAAQMRRIRSTCPSRAPLRPPVADGYESEASPTAPERAGCTDAVQQGRPYSSR